METKAFIGDAELLSSMLFDDKKAFEGIYNRYWETLLDTAFRRLGNIELAKDIVQEVFVDLWNRRHKVTIGNLQAYLYNAVMYQVFKTVSREKNVPAFTELFDSITSTQFSSDHNYIEKELSGLFDQWLNSLPEKRREIFLLSYRENLSTREIAERLKISQKTVQNQLGTATHDFHDKVVLSTFILLSLDQFLK